MSYVGNTTVTQKANATINMEMKSKMMTTQYPENKNIKKINRWISTTFTFVQSFTVNVDPSKWK
jgi:hypothetical protein